MLLLFISTFIMQTICNINLGNTNQRILKKSFSVPIDAFFWNQAIIDDNENLYVGNNVFKDIWIIISSQDGQIQL